MNALLSGYESSLGSWLTISLALLGPPQGTDWLKRKLSAVCPWKCPSTAFPGQEVSPLNYPTDLHLILKHGKR